MNISTNNLSEMGIKELISLLFSNLTYIIIFFLISVVITSSFLYFMGSKLTSKIIIFPITSLDYISLQSPDILYIQFNNEVLSFDTFKESYSKLENKNDRFKNFNKSMFIESVFMNSLIEDNEHSITFNLPFNIKNNNYPNLVEFNLFHNEILNTANKKTIIKQIEYYEMELKSKELIFKSLNDNISMFMSDGSNLDSFRTKIFEGTIDGVIEISHLVSKIEKLKESVKYLKDNLNNVSVVTYDNLRVDTNLINYLNKFFVLSLMFSLILSLFLTLTLSVLLRKK